MGKQGKHACDDDGPNEQKTLERSIEVKLIKGAVKNHFDFYSPFKYFKYDSLWYYKILRFYPTISTPSGRSSAFTMEFPLIFTLFKFGRFRRTEMSVI